MTTPPGQGHGLTSSDQPEHDRLVGVPIGLLGGGQGGVVDGGDAASGTPVGIAEGAVVDLDATPGHETPVDGG
jgi:hypothetical protein